MKEVTCEQCNKTRKVKRIYGTTCRECSDKARRASNWHPDGYTQNCMDCGKTWIAKYSHKSKRCMKCSGQYLGKKLGVHNTKKPEDKVKHKMTCDACGETRYINANPKYRKTNLCGLCSRQATGLSNRKPKEEYFRVCPECPEGSNTMKVSKKSNSGSKRCKLHASQHSAKTRKPKPKPKQYYVKKVRTTKTVSQEAIDKVREANKKHRESEQNRTISQIIQTSQEKHDSMIADFLSKNEPSTTIRDEPIPHFEQQMWMKD